MDHQQTLPAGTVLNDNYTVVSVLGQGGFAKTYLADDKALNRQVAIKEYFPRDYAVRHGMNVQPVSDSARAPFETGRERFDKEAQTLAKLPHPNIVRVFRSFDANSTCYIVLEYIEGEDLEDWLTTLGRPPNQAELDKLVTPLLSALEHVHNGGILHRDVTPKNIRIRRLDGAPVLLDFGAAKAVVAAGAAQRTMGVFVPGYTPIEAYGTTAKRQGAWTDIYGLSATIYRGLSGAPPPGAPDRLLHDSIEPAAKLPLKKGNGYRPQFLAAIDWGLEILPEKRPQRIEQWREKLLDGRTSTTGRTTARPTGRTTGRPKDKTLPPTAPVPTEPATGPATRTGRTEPSKTEHVPPGARPKPRGLSMGAIFGGLLMLGGGATVAAIQMKLVDVAAIAPPGPRIAMKTPEPSKPEPNQTKPAEPAPPAPKAVTVEPPKETPRPADPPPAPSPPVVVEPIPPKPEDKPPVVANNDLGPIVPPTPAPVPTPALDAQKVAPAWNKVVESSDHEPLKTLAASPDGKWLATATDGGKVRFWQSEGTASAKENGRTISVGGQVKTMTFAPGKDSVSVAIATIEKGAISFWNSRSGKKPPAADDQRRVVQALGYNDNNTNFIAVSLVQNDKKYKTQVDRWESDGSEKGDAMTLDVGERAPSAAAIAHLSETVAIARPQGGVLLFEPGKTKSSVPLEKAFAGKTALALAFSEKDTRIAMAGQSNDVEIWEVPAASQQPGAPVTLEMQQASGPDIEIRALAFDPGDRYLAAASTSGLVIVWEIATKAIVSRQEVPSGDLRWLSLLPARQGRGATLLVPWNDGTVREFAIGADG